MLKIGFELEKVLLFSKDALLPMGILGGFLAYFFCVSDISEDLYHGMHISFLIFSVLTLISAIYLRISITAMTSAVIYISYLIINGMRYTYGEDYMFSAGYNIWSMLLFPNLLLIYLCFQNKKTYRQWSLFFIFILLETTLMEKLHNQSIDTDSYHFYRHIGMLNYPAFYLALLSLLILSVYQITRGKILTSAVLFSSIAVFIGIYCSENIYTYTLFFLTAALINFTATLYDAYYVYYKDENLAIPNMASFIKDSKKKYPLKYSIALMYIDEYERLIKRFGPHKALILKKMLINRICKANPEALIYNLRADALVLAFMNANATETFEKVDNIRRIIAKSIFVFNENNHLQLTVSQCISEFKRSDTDALEVLNRAEENLQKACRFTRNVTIKA